MIDAGVPAEGGPISVMLAEHNEGRNFVKKEAESAQAIPELKIIVKKDPGVTLVILCFALLCLLMFWYFPQIYFLKKL